MRKETIVVMIPAQTFENGECSIAVMCFHDANTFKAGQALIATSFGLIIEIEADMCPECGSLWVTIEDGTILSKAIRGEE